MESVTVDHDDLARLFVVGALNSKSIEKGLATVENHEVSTMVNTYHALLITVERVKEKLGFPKEVTAIDAAITLINQKIWAEGDFHA